MLNQVGDSVP